MRSVRLAIVLFVGAASVPLASFAQTPAMPLPAGPFGIGRVGYDWTDDSRQEDESADPKVHRELMVYFWYPAAEKSAETRGAYIPGGTDRTRPRRSRRRRGIRKCLGGFRPCDRTDGP